jgi:hypothetical protein
MDGTKVAYVAPPTSGSLDLTLTRFDGGSGSVRVSSGVPLSVGQMSDAQLANLRVLVNGSEVASYVEKLGLNYQIGAGGVRSVLVQFDVDPATVTTCQLDWSGTRNLTSTKSSVLYTDGVPPCVAWPDTTQFLDSGVLGHPARPIEDTPTTPEWVRLLDATDGTYNTGTSSFKLQYDGRLWAVWSGTGDSTARQDMPRATFAWGVRANDREYIRRASRQVFEYVTPEASTSWTTKPKNGIRGGC